MINNQGDFAGAQASTPINKTKNIDVKYHMPQQLKIQQIVQPIYIPTDDMWADELTKPLSKDKFTKHKNDMRVENLPQQRL